MAHGSRGGEPSAAHGEGPGGSDDRRVRISLPGRRARDLEALASIFGAVGALEVTLAVEAPHARLIARLAAEEPPYLEDRVEAWLHNLDPRGTALLETARGAGPWEPGWRAIYGGALVPPFHIRPPWTAALDGYLAVVVDPRGGFGSGLHPTTVIALRALAAVARGAEGTGLLDVGCGSGVLSIAGARLGLVPTAVDIEACALQATRRAAGENAVSVRVLEGGIEAVAERFPVIVANLNSAAVRHLAVPIRERLAPQGTAILSGFHPEELDEVAAAYGLGPGERLLSPDGEWAGLTLRAP